MENWKRYIIEIESVKNRENLCHIKNLCIYTTIKKELVGNSQSTAIWWKMHTVAGKWEESNYQTIFDVVCWILYDASAIGVCVMIIIVGHGGSRQLASWPPLTPPPSPIQPLYFLRAFFPSVLTVPVVSIYFHFLLHLCLSLFCWLGWCNCGVLLPPLLLYLPPTRSGDQAPSFICVCVCK